MRALAEPSLASARSAAEPSSPPAVVTTQERLWFAYCAAVTVVALAADGGGGDGHAPWAFVGVHAGIALLQLLPIAAARRGALGLRRVLQALLACAGLPAVFSALALVLPHLHPEPYELPCYRFDVAVFGGDVTAGLRARLGDAAVAWLQFSYASFYLLPIAAALAALRRRGVHAFDRAVATATGCFLISYLGYLWFPTLAPKLVLPLAGAPAADGGALAATVAQLIDAGECNPRDCMPSGHTMLSLVAVILVWRHARSLLLPFLAVVVPLIAATLCLRYHWPIDVAVGAALAWPTVRACDLLLDRDGAPR